MSALLLRLQLSAARWCYRRALFAEHMSPCERLHSIEHWAHTVADLRVRAAA